MVRIELKIHRPMAQVFDYMADFSNENEWNIVAHDIKLLTDGSLGVGSRFRGEYDRMGTMEYEIKEYDRPLYLGVEGRARMFTWFSTFTFTESSGVTTLVGTIDPNPKGPLRLIKPVMERVMKGQMSKGMGSFKSSLEGSPGPAVEAQPLA